MRSRNGNQAVKGTVVSKLRDWITDRHQRFAEIGMDANLITEGALDSLEMVNFLLYIEEIRGEEIPEELIQPSNFASLRVICDKFFGC